MESEDSVVTTERLARGGSVEIPDPAAVAAAATPAAVGAEGKEPTPTPTPIRTRTPTHHRRRRLKENEERTLLDEIRAEAVGGFGLGWG
jgi:hypothetical protein